MLKTTLGKLLLISLLLIVLAGCGGGAEPTTAPVATEGAPVDATTAPVATEPPTEATAVPTENVVRFQNEGEGRFNVAEFDLRPLAAPPENLVYYAWLVADDGSSVLLGEVPYGAVTPFPDAEGRNLLSIYSGAWVSLETAGSTPTEPTLDVLGGRLPAALLPTLRELFATGVGTPDGTPFEPGTKLQAEIAYEHGGLLLDAASGGDLAGAHKHAEHVINIIVGEGSGDQFGIAFGDHNGDGAAENPGDGYGVLPYSNEAIARLDIIIESADASDRMKGYARQARQCLVNVGNQETAALGHAQAVLAAADAATAGTAGEALKAATDAALNGVDANGNGTIEAVVGECGATQAYQIGHDIGAILLEPITE